MGRVMLRLWALLRIGLVLVHATDSDHAGFDGDYSELSDTEVRLGEADVQLLRHDAKPPLKKLKKKASAKKAKKQKKAAKKEMKKAAKKAKKKDKMKAKMMAAPAKAKAKAGASSPKKAAIKA